ncbi:MAG: hypothetical protein AABX08_02860 [Nanoarchaeota archaeon]
MINKNKVEEIYLKIKDKLKSEEGKIVAIDTDSEDYFIGNDALEAYEKGIKKHPGKEFFFKRIGTKYPFVVGAF